MEDFGESSSFLDISFKITEDFISIDQSHYLEVLLR